MIGIEGEIQTRTFEDKNGNKRKATEIVVSHVSFCGSKSGNNNSGEIENDPLPALADKLDSIDFTEVSDDDDLPF
jgi:single-strand DNA-binding protein